MEPASTGLWRRWRAIVAWRSVRKSPAPSRPVDPSLEPRGPADDEAYAENRRPRARSFDETLLQEPIAALPRHEPMVFSEADSVAAGMRAMQESHSTCVLVTEDGTRDTSLIGIFTDRDVLFRVINRGRNPTELPLGDVMTPAPEALVEASTIGQVLNRMAVDGFRQFPVVDEFNRPASVVSARDVVDFLVETFPREVLNIPRGSPGSSLRTREGA